MPELTYLVITELAPDVLERTTKLPEHGHRYFNWLRRKWRDEEQTYESDSHLLHGPATVAPFTADQVAAAEVDAEAAYGMEEVGREQSTPMELE